jgi:hypothetical protein
MKSFEATDNLPECPFPLSHLNGSGKVNLIAEYVEAKSALDKFCTALSKVTCHPRDYYPLGEDAFTSAKETRNAVFSLCDEISAYLEDHLKDLAE